MSKKKVLLRGVFINRDTNGEGVLKVGTTLIRVSTVMGILYILRFNDIIQKDGIMYKEQIEEILSGMISIKQNYSLSDVVYCCMMINQKTLDKIDKIIEDA